MAKDFKGLIEDTAHGRKGAILVFVIGVLGMCAILVAKTYGYSQLVVTLCPVSLMIFYAILLRTPGLRLRDDQSGDNLYYIGFLFTLTSMAVSLREFSNDSRAENVITNFGIAISTTIVGIILRVAFNQMRSDTAGIERVARMELADTSRRLRVEMDNTVLELKQFHRANLQSAQESHTAMRRMTEETLKTLVLSVEEFSTKSIQSVLDRDATSADGSAKLQKSIGLTSKALDKISTQLDLFKSPEALIRFDMEPAKEKLDSIINEIRREQEEHHVVIGRTFDVLHATAQGINELVANSHAFLSDFTPLMERMVRLETQMLDKDRNQPNSIQERRPIWDIFGERSGK